MFQLEDSDVELCDEIYELYTDLLQETEEEEDSLCYKSYFLVRGKTLHLFFFHEVHPACTLGGFSPEN